ncbi:protein translocase subunit SecA, chloroplastic isoform X2 [Cryptomeria japonica]|uniref:protein translocase subunit SecA, chloroplastic isoform X2 n=1 Tax=Cryptomeria japonica TaxID=3369 RepID=UPI0027DAAEA7|nr:protein translocase subunit SecA, chloroplastic isoform X2 [Cryptomeria japonica]
MAAQMLAGAFLRGEHGATPCASHQIHIQSSSVGPCSTSALPSPFSSSPPSVHYHGLCSHSHSPGELCCSFSNRKGRISSWEGGTAPSRGCRDVKATAVASLGGLLGGLFKGNDMAETTRQQYAGAVAAVNALEEKMSQLSDDELRGKTVEFKQRITKGESLDSLLPEAFAVVREASKRVLGLRPFDVQLIENMSSEQRRANYSYDMTYVTNSELGFDYLRDNLATSVQDLVLRGFNFCIIDEVDSILIDEARTPLIISGSAEKPSDRYYKAAKIADAFVRDVHYTVDEKQKTVLLSEQGYEDAEEILDVKDLYDPREQWASFVLNAIKAKELFLRDVNYIIRGKEVLIVDEFTGRVMQGRRWSDGLHQAVEAKEGVPIQNETVTLASISYQNFFLQFPKLCGMTGTAATESTEFESIYKLRVTVVPTNKRMIRKDESDVVFRAATGKWQAVLVEVSRMHKTGRPVLVGTTSVEQSDSLSEQLKEIDIPHEILNAKPENVEREAEIIAQSGRLGAVTIATNMAGRGTDIILGGNAEFMARLKLRELLMPRIVNAINEVQLEGKQKLPVRKNWKVNKNLFPCELSPDNMSLAENAVQMAVRTWGKRSLTELEAEDRLSYACEKGPTQDEVIANLRSVFESIVREYRIYTEEEKKEVIAAGGLHVLGTERHESRRIDNQLRGRSGRQGDPGSSRFFLSLEDNIFRIFGGDRIQGLMRAFRVEDLPIESKMLTKALDEAQRKVENYFFEIRKNLFEYDEVLNSQRERVYTERRRALEADNLQPQLIEYAELTMDDILEANIGPETPKENWNLDALVTKLQQYCYLLNDLTPELLVEKCSSYDSLQEYLRFRGREAYLQKKEEIEKEAPSLMKEAERFFVLTHIDRLWKEHLQAIKFVQQAVGLRGYAQRDPLIEYKLEGYNLFLEMMAQIRRNVIYSIYQFKPVMVKAAKDQAPNQGRKDPTGQQDTVNGMNSQITDDSDSVPAAQVSS